MGNCLSLHILKSQKVEKPTEVVVAKQNTPVVVQRFPLPPVEMEKHPIPSSPTEKREIVKESLVVSSRILTHADIDDFRKMDGFGDMNVFTYEEMRLATKDFRPDLILGEGGFGLVYKGVIDHTIRPGYESTVVAVKELNPEGLQGDKEWLAELNYLGQFRHPNLVKLIGYCCEGENRMLVYEYMACGSLERHLFRRTCNLTWTTRMKIALDAAKGLAFLHGAEAPLIYRDFKTSNILLDGEYNGKLSDFGLAKEGPIGEQTHVSTRVMGTYGYAAPEYMMTGHLTAKSDVYGYGVVLLEILTGRRALDNGRPTREQNLVDWARPILIRPNKLLRIIDLRMEGNYYNFSVERVGKLTHECLSQNPKYRPSMQEVVDTLSDIIESEKYVHQNSGTSLSSSDDQYETDEDSAVAKQHCNTGKEHKDVQPQQQNHKPSPKRQNVRCKSESRGAMGSSPKHKMSDSIDDDI